jgi:hypothetical protein
MKGKVGRKVRNVLLCLQQPAADACMDPCLMLSEATAVLLVPLARVTCSMWKEAQNHD